LTLPTSQISVTTQPFSGAADTISVIVPVYNAAIYLPQVLSPLIEMCRRGEVVEVIVVDDSSSDDSVAVAEALGAMVISTKGRYGPGKARNIGATHAKSEIVWFVDSDVVVHENAAAKILSYFKSIDVVAIFGSYDDAPPAQNFCSQYKNLVHHFYHQRSAVEASTFWAGCGAVRKSAFMAIDGFDTERYLAPSIEDIEFGYRLRASGGRIHLVREIQGTHLKLWRLRGLLHTEIFRRALPWSQLIMESKNLISDLNIGWGERLRAALAILFLIMLLLALGGIVSWWLSAFAVLTTVAVNTDLFKLFYRRNGAWFAIRGVLFHQLYYLYSTAAYVWTWLRFKVFQRLF
jgi:glycosyltransferase involved in cell wall biosynthesis